MKGTWLNIGKVRMELPGEWEDYPGVEGAIRFVWDEGCELVLGGVPMHLEALEVVVDGCSQEMAPDSDCTAEIDALYTLDTSDKGFQTIEFDGRHYIPYLIPHGR